MIIRACQAFRASAEQIKLAQIWLLDDLAVVTENTLLTLLTDTHSTHNINAHNQ